jgi:hypothetical protein
VTGRTSQSIRAGGFAFQIMKLFGSSLLASPIHGTWNAMCSCGGDMRIENIMVATAVATGLFITGASAQHEGHTGQPAPSPAPSTDKTDKADTGKMGGMMSQMQKMMLQMMMDQAATSKLVEQLIQGLAAIEAEKDPAALQAKLAEQEALLKELQTKVQAHSQMMEKMQH